jgi:hypothetical protein
MDCDRNCANVSSTLLLHANGACQSGSFKSRKEDKTTYMSDGNGSSDNVDVDGAQHQQQRLVLQSARSDPASVSTPTAVFSSANASLLNLDAGAGVCSIAAYSQQQLDELQQQTQRKEQLQLVITPQKPASTPQSTALPGSNQFASLSSISPRNAYLSSIQQQQQRPLIHSSDHRIQQLGSRISMYTDASAAAAASFAADFAGSSRGSLASGFYGSSSGIAARNSTGTSPRKADRFSPDDAAEQVKNGDVSSRTSNSAGCSSSSGSRSRATDIEVPKTQSNNNSLSSTPIIDTLARNTSSRSSISRVTPTLAAPSPLHTTYRALDDFISRSEGAIHSPPGQNLIDLDYSATRQLGAHTIQHRQSLTGRRSSYSGATSSFTTDHRRGVPVYSSILKSAYDNDKLKDEIDSDHEDLVPHACTTVSDDHFGDRFSNTQTRDTTTNTIKTDIDTSANDHILDSEASPSSSTSRFTSRNTLDLDQVADYLTKYSVNTTAPLLPPPHHLKTLRFMFYSDLTGQLNSATFESLPFLGGSTPDMGIHDILSAGPFWIDVCQPTTEEMNMFTRVFGIHPLTAEDIQTDDTYSREKCEVRCF